VPLPILALSIVASAPTWAADPLGLYVGGAVGQAHVQADNLPNPDAVSGFPSSIASFRENHTAYKFMVGLRPISLVGAEVAYVDFGHPTGTVGTLTLAGTIPVPISADVKMKGTAAFGVLYLPVPVVDIYLKAGLARLQTTEVTTFTLPAPFATCVISGGPNCTFSSRYSATNTGLALGAGAQFKFGSLAVRGEYERFSAAGGNPSLFSLGLTWTFF
jgi:opacity protein-like surface antigen